MQCLCHSECERDMAKSVEMTISISFPSRTGATVKRSLHFHRSPEHSVRDDHRPRCQGTVLSSVTLVASATACAKLKPITPTPPQSSRSRSGGLAWTTAKRSRKTRRKTHRKTHRKKKKIRLKIKTMKDAVSVLNQHTFQYRCSERTVLTCATYCSKSKQWSSKSARSETGSSSPAANPRQSWAVPPVKKIKKWR